MGKLAEALDPVLPLATSKAFLEANYDSFYKETYQARLAEKLGLVDDGQDKNMLQSDTEMKLVSDFWETMEKTGSDFTNTFRDLASISKIPDMTE